MERNKKYYYDYYYYCYYYNSVALKSVASAGRRAQFYDRCRCTESNA